MAQRRHSLPSDPIRTSRNNHRPCGSGCLRCGWTTAVVGPEVRCMDVLSRRAVSGASAGAASLVALGAHAEKEMFDALAHDRIEDWLTKNQVDSLPPVNQVK